MTLDSQSTKLVFIICDAGVEPDAMDILRAQGHEHYTLWGDCEGAGETGIRQGNPVWPGLNTVIMVVMAADAIEPLVTELHKMRDSFAITPGMKLIVTDGVII
ncbi:MAG: PG0541 family transporter-associated protein [Armatimonadota bacterium]